MLKVSHRSASDGRCWISFAFDRSAASEVERRVARYLAPESANHVIETLWFGRDLQSGQPGLHVQGAQATAEMYCEVSMLEKERPARFSTFNIGHFRIHSWESGHGQFLTGSGHFASFAETFRLLDHVVDDLDLDALPLCRTWFYLPDIDHNYSQFNVARDRFFNNRDITFFPASTGVGIGGDKGIFRFEFSTGLQRESGCAETMTLQCRPVEYGPKFERVNIISSSKHKELLISGISSVEKNGQSMKWSAHEDVEFALESFSEVLNSNGATWDDLVSVYFYAINEDVLRFAANEIAMRTSIVAPRALNRICRSDLRFEIEGRAIVDA